MKTKIDRRIRLTPEPEMEEVLEELIAGIKTSSGVTISRVQALAFFAERGVKSWRRKISENGQNGQNGDGAQKRDPLLALVQRANNERSIE